jgi:hypothetical protein
MNNMHSFFGRLYHSSIPRRAAVMLVALLAFCGKLLAADDSASQFTIELANDLGVKATIHVTGFTAGKETWGDHNHDMITTELNYMGGEWAAQPVSGRNGETPNGDFPKSRFVIVTDNNQFVLIPWQSFKSLSLQDGVQLVRLNDGTEYKGKLRTILNDDSGSEKKVYELSGATSMAIVQMPKQAVPVTTSNSKGSQWKVTTNGMSDLIVSQPRFVFSIFHVTSGGGIYVENGFYDTKVSEQFGVAKKGSEQNSTSATISDFESISIGGVKDAFGMPVTVKAKGADAVSGILAVTPFGLEAWANEYLNRSMELAGDLSNGCTIVFREWRSGDELKLERIHTSEQKP